MRGVLVVGGGEAGKDTFAEYLSLLSAPILRYDNLTGSTSRAIANHIAKLLGTDPEEEFSNRRSNRDLWLLTGNQIRTNNGPDALVRWCEGRGNNIITGVRTYEEVHACKDRFLVVEVVRPGSTSHVGSFYRTTKLVDTIIWNSQGLQELRYLVASFWRVFECSIAFGLPFPVQCFGIGLECTTPTGNSEGS